MTQCKYLVILAFVLLTGCTHYQTMKDATGSDLRPLVLRGQTNEIQLVAYEAAKKAFPDETENIKMEGTDKVTILREWFWRGDTLITVLIERGQEDECIINVESTASWHRFNPSGLSVSKDEIAHYFSILTNEYNSLREKQRKTANASDERTLESRLIALKQAFERGLIDKAEYEQKRKEIIREY